MKGMRIVNKKLYTKQVSEYAAASPFRGDEEIVFNKYFKGESVLVLGCGGGRTLVPILDRGYKVVAIDIIPEMVAAAKERLKGNPVEIFNMDASDLKFVNNSFDTVFFPFHGIDYVEPDIYASVIEAARVMKEDGVFIFSSHNRLFLKKLHRFFIGTHDTYRGLYTYRTSPMDYFKLKKVFSEVIIKQRIMLMDYKSTNWKDKMYRLVPWLNKSTYFICSKPIRND
jgi:SAM-dependent methyltransferase